MNIEILKESWQEMIQENPLTANPSVLTLAELFGLSNLPHGLRVQLGNRFEKFINQLLKKHKKVTSFKDDSSNLWINTETNEVIVDGNGEGMKDIDTLFIIDGTTYYLEEKTNLKLDTEKSTKTIEKVKTITDCLKNNENYPNVIGRVLSCFWDETNVPISSGMKTSGLVMYFSEFNDILDLGLTKSKWEDICKEFGEMCVKNETDI
tara:strand:+ start:63 stop:683 length:621 start_codon:yes stop_codon:yes gene_type:complete